MARKSLKPQLNQIRTWVRQGRTDAWIAHQLQVTVRDIDAFKRQHDLAEGGDSEAFDDDMDLRAEDDALVAEQLEAEPEEEDEPEAEAASDDSSGGEDGDDKPKRRRRGRRGGRGRRRKAKPLEGTFDHGEEGYGLWLDPAVQDNGTYAEHWAGQRDVVVAIEADRIVITRAGEEPDQGSDDSGSE